MMLLSACTNNEADSPQQTDTAVGQAKAIQVFFIDVGKGDASLIGLPGGHWVMVDTGPKEGFAEIGRTLMSQGITRLDAIFITHGHKDHIGGLESVLKIAACNRIYTIPDCLDEKEISNAKEDFGVEAAALTADQSVQIGDAVLTVLGPVGDYEEENDDSMVLMLDVKGTKILFTADQLFAAESGLLSSGKDLKADVLKVAHHGQDDSTSTAFAKAVGAGFAVIPTDTENMPAKQTLNAVSLAGTSVFVLGETGTLVYDGESISKIPVPDGEVPLVSVSDKDVSAEFVKITNRSEQPIDLTGWCLVSEKGSDTYFFPSETELPPNGNLTVYSGKAAGNNTDGLNWTTKNIWSNKKDDICQLFDSYGRLAGSL
jgi:beta-lactamase superfamily II metal-dependent hydrolase